MTKTTNATTPRAYETDSGYVIRHAGRWLALTEGGEYPVDAPEGRPMSDREIAIHPWAGRVDP